MKSVQPQGEKPMLIFCRMALGLLLLALTSPSFASNLPFAEEIRLFGVEDEIYPPAGCETLFVGSSSFRFWARLQQDFPKRKILKRGFGGASIADISLHFDRVVGRYRPREIVFYAGENDINGGKPVEMVLEDFKRFLDRKSALLGNTPVYFVSVKPSIARTSDFSKQTRLNEIISGLAATRDDLVFVDIVQPMLRKGQARPELYISDGLHMNSAGYSIWKKKIMQALSEGKRAKMENC